MSKWLLNVRQWEQTARFALYSSRLLAKYHRISLRELQRQFQYVYKVKVHQWLKHVRLTDAAKLLQPEVKISEVAALVRYPQSNNFTRDFKRKFGVTPEEYIKQNCPNPRNELFAHQYRLLMQYIDQHPVYSPKFQGTLEEQAEARLESRKKLKESLDAKIKIKGEILAKKRRDRLEKRLSKTRRLLATRQKRAEDSGAFLRSLAARTKLRPGTARVPLKADRTGLVTSRQAKKKV